VIDAGAATLSTSATPALPHQPRWFSVRRVRCFDTTKNAALAARGREGAGAEARGFAP
jgi:hypothetical protein